MFLNDCNEYVSNVRQSVKMLGKRNLANSEKMVETIIPRKTRVKLDHNPFSGVTV